MDGEGLMVGAELDPILRAKLAIQGDWVPVGLADQAGPASGRYRSRHCDGSIRH